MLFAITRTVSFAATAASVSVALFSSGAVGAQAPQACPFSQDALKAAFGVNFDAGKAQPAMGTGCTYKAVSAPFTVGVYINVSLPEAQRKMFLAAGTKHELVPVPGDTDNAVWVRHRGDVPAFAQVAYVRRGFDVRLQVTGSGFEPDEKVRAAKIERLNQQLLKLSRVP
ncbi:MAG: hypothetical protein JNL19_01490 [Burkholderiales bacterium]|nr:hypothetical protein [Burkholderiales bacterium]